MKNYICGLFLFVMLFSYGCDQNNVKISNETKKNIIKTVSTVGGTVVGAKAAQVVANKATTDKDLINIAIVSGAVLGGSLAYASADSNSEEIVKAINKLTGSETPEK